MRQAAIHLDLWHIQSSLQRGLFFRSYMWLFVTFKMVELACEKVYQH